MRHRSKKSKHEHKHKRHKSDKRHHHGSDSDDEERPLRPPQVQAEPWHCMQFELIDGVNDYGQHEPDSRVLRGLAPTSAPNVYDMSDFTRLVSYARETFEIDPELAIVLSVPVRCSSALFPLAQLYSHWQQCASFTGLPNLRLIKVFSADHLPLFTGQFTTPQNVTSRGPWRVPGGSARSRMGLKPSEKGESGF